MAVLTLIQKTTEVSSDRPDAVVSLTAEERQRSFLRCLSDQGKTIRINLQRGTVLQEGDILLSEQTQTGKVWRVAIAAKPEPVLTVTAHHSLHLMKAAYHLGNRHVALEVREQYLRLSPDPVLRAMLEKMPVTLVEEIVPFHPETGAYHHHHG